MAKAVCKVPAGTLALYDTLLATNPCVKRKGAASAYPSLNGHMFSFMTEAGSLALRLPTGAREAFLKKYSTKLCVQYGTVMKEYVEVPAALLKKRGYCRRSSRSAIPTSPRSNRSRRRERKPPRRRRPARRPPAERPPHERN